MTKKLFFIYFYIYYIFLIIYAYYMNIGNLEIEYLDKNYPISYIENIFLFFFGNNNISLRLPSLILSILSIFFYYQIAKKYLKKQNDVYFSTIIFSLLPGFIMASLLFNKSIYIIFLVSFFIYLFLYHRFLSYIILAFYTIVDYSFFSLYLGLIFYSIYKKDTKFLIYSIFLFMINANYFDYTIGGKPKGHFLDVLLIYFSIFSPFVFIYFIYALIKSFKRPTILWFISTTTLLFSFILSFRQRIKIDDFAPFVVVSVVFMVAVFFKNYRIRLKLFRLAYQKLFYFLLVSLIIFDVLLFLSPYIFDYKIFYQFRYSKQIVNFCKDKNINYLYCKDKHFCKKLYFYGLKKGNNYFLSFDKVSKKVSISHNHKVLYKFYVSKLNKK